MKVISTTKAPGAIGPYSQGYEVNGFVFSSGQIPVNPETGEIPEGIAAQAEQSCKNVGAILEAAGVGYDNVVKTIMENYMKLSSFEMETSGIEKKKTLFGSK